MFRFVLFPNCVRAQMLKLLDRNIRNYYVVASVHTNALQFTNMCYAYPVARIGSWGSDDKVSLGPYDYLSVGKFNFLQ